MSAICKKSEQNPHSEAFAKFSKMEIAEFKEGFTLFDKDSDGLLDIKEISNVMRSLGQNPSNEDIKFIIEDAQNIIFEARSAHTENISVKENGNEREEEAPKTGVEEGREEASKSPTEDSSTGERELIDFPEFVEVMSRWNRPVDTKEVLLEAFRVFDKMDIGVIPEQEMKVLLTTLSEIFTVEELEAFTNLAKANEEGMINYGQLVEEMFSV